MLLYHYTCVHAAPRIRDDALLKVNPQPLLAGLPVVWLTDLDVPDWAGLGLTMETISCDRGEFRFAVDTDRAVHWPAACRQWRIRRDLRDLLEHAPGRLPMH